MSNISAEDLKQLKELMDEGIITKEEFEKKKNEFLDTFNKSIENNLSNEKKNAHLENNSINNDEEKKNTSKEKEFSSTEKSNLKINDPFNKNTHVNKKTRNNSPGCLKKLIFTVIGLFLISVIFGALLESSETQQNPKSETEQETNISKDDEKLTENDWKNFDKKSWDDYIEIINYNNSILSALKNPTNMNNYEVIKNGKNFFMNKYAALDYGNNEEQKQYLNDISLVCLSGQNTCKYALKYIDSNKPSDLSKVTDSIYEFKDRALLIAGNRNIILKNAGYSESEINEIINNIENDLKN